MLPAPTGPGLSLPAPPPDPPGPPFFPEPDAFLDPPKPPPVDVTVEKTEGVPVGDPGVLQSVAAGPPPPTVIGKPVAVTVIGVAPFRGEAV